MGAEAGRPLSLLPCGSRTECDHVGRDHDPPAGCPGDCSPLAGVGSTDAPDLGDLFGVGGAARCRFHGKRSFDVATAHGLAHHPRRPGSHPVPASQRAPGPGPGGSTVGSLDSLGAPALGISRVALGSGRTGWAHSYQGYRADPCIRGCLDRRGCARPSPIDDQRRIDSDWFLLIRRGMPSVRPGGCRPPPLRHCGPPGSAGTPVQGSRRNSRAMVRDCRSSAPGVVPYDCGFFALSVVVAARYRLRLDTPPGRVRLPDVIWRSQ